MKNIFIIALSFLSISLFGQQTNSFTIERTDTHSASLNLKNTIGFWHLTGPRSYESNNNISLMWNGGNGYERFLTVLDNGNTGIGVGNPLSKLEVGGTLRTSFSSARYLAMHSNSDGNAYLNYVGGASSSRIGFQINGTSRLSIMNNGYIGIGTTAPVEAFQLGDRWTFHNGGHKIIGYNYDYNAGDKRITDDEVAAIRFTDAGDMRFLTSGSGVAGSSIGWSYTLVLKNDGRVGIGLENPSDRLTVDGRIRGKEVKVNIVNGPDYVFDPGYQLRTLQATKVYIREHKHLPEIPSANEMEKDGIDLGDMNMRLLKKIEELTLYQIQLLEQLEQQQGEINKLKEIITKK